MTQIQTAAARLRINGFVCEKCLSIAIEQTRYAEAGTFRACVILDDRSKSAPVWSALIPTISSQRQEVLVEIAFGRTGSASTPATWESMMVGRVDHLAMDVESGIIELEGRDLLGRLMDLPSTTSFVNQTSSQIVAALAAEAGLVANVQATSTIVGQFYELEHSRGSLNAFTRFSNAFDIVSYLAHAEGFDCWADGQTLNFQPSGGVGARALTIDLSQLGPFMETATPFKRLRLNRRVGLDNGARVIVRSWNSRQRNAVEGSSSLASAAANFTFVSPNLTSEAASGRASALYNDIVRHRRSLSGDMTGDTILMPRSILQVVGSNGWDGLYIVDSVSRQLDATGGFSQSFIARPQ